MRNTFIYCSRISIKEGLDIAIATNHISKIPTENVLIVKKCSLLAKILNLMSKFVMSVITLSQRLIANLVKCLYFGLIMHFFKFSQIYV